MVIIIIEHLLRVGASQVALVVKNPPTNAEDIRDAGSIPGSGRSPGGGHYNLLQYSCLESPMDRGAPGYSPQGDTQLDTTKHTHICIVLLHHCKVEKSTISYTIQSWGLSVV